MKQIKILLLSLFLLFSFTEQNETYKFQKKYQKMKLGHILYKVDDLDRAVQEYIEKGFTVEYGRKNNPYNAVIYFAEGPYLELFYNSGMPSFVKKIFTSLTFPKFLIVMINLLVFVIECQKFPVEFHRSKPNISDFLQKNYAPSFVVPNSFCIQSYF